MARDGARVMQASWTTHDIDVGARYAYWKDAICEAILNVAPEELDPATFNADLCCRSVGRIKLTSFTSSGHRIVRTPRHVSQSDQECVLISYQQVGTTRMVQGDDEFVLGCGEIGVVNAARPFRAEFVGNVSRAIAVVPADMVYRRAPWLRGTIGAKIGHGSAHIKLGRMMFESLLDEAGEDADFCTSLLVESLCNVLAMSTGGRDANRVDEMRAAKLLAECFRQLDEPDLSPETVASACHMSVRTLHHRFAALGTTFGRWILENRLERCIADLQNPLYAGSSISEIAFRWGFNDLSHFNKTFRRRYGKTPGSARRME